MKCHQCHRREASVHLLDHVGDGGKNVWLCVECAATQHAESGAAGGAEPLASLLGEALAMRSDGAPRVCSGCGTTPEDMRRENRLGCARCYVVFRRQLLPLLARYHRHVSHVGRVPRAACRPTSRLVEMARLRVGLEKAIAVEDFERAAGLRDRLRALEADGTQVGEGGP